MKNLIDDINKIKNTIPSGLTQQMINNFKNTIPSGLTNMMNDINKIKNIIPSGLTNMINTIFTEEDLKFINFCKNKEISNIIEYLNNKNFNPVSCSNFCLIRAYIDKNNKIISLLLDDDRIVNDLKNMEDDFLDIKNYLDGIVRKKKIDKLINK